MALVWPPSSSVARRPVRSLHCFDSTMPNDGELDTKTIDVELRLQELSAQRLRAEDLFMGYRAELADDFDDEDI